MLYTNYDYDKSKIRMEAGDDPSSPKNYRAMKFLQKLIVIISEWGDPATPMMYHELSARYLFVGGSDTPNLHRILTVLYPFGVTSIP